MITRVTDKMKYDLLNNSISTVQNQYSSLMEKMATMKQINRPSDDPLGMGKILDYRAAKSHISNYESNIESSKSWITVTESKLTAVNDILVQIQQMAVEQGSATASETSREIAASSLQPLIDQVLSLANSTFEGRYLFSGTRTVSDTEIDIPVAEGGNTFDGTVSLGAGSAYTGASNDKTFMVKITGAGTLATAKYTVSSDGGTTWGTEQTFPGPAGGPATITPGDGINLTFTAGTSDFEVDDLFTVNAARTDIDPFSATASAARIDNPITASRNTYAGAVTAGGTYTGTTNKTYVVKIITGGALAAAEYKVSSDGGKTWGALQTDLDGGTITLGDGITMTFPAGTFAADDVFSVNAYAAGYYNGNGEESSADVGKGVTLNYGVSGEAAFTDQGDGTVDIFTVLNDLKTALQNNDAEGIRNQINSLRDAGDQITRYTAKCGTRTNSLDISDTTLKDLDTRLTERTSNIEDADVAALTIEYQSKQLALQASYQMAAQIGGLSIINFLE